MKKDPSKDELKKMDIVLFALYKLGGISKKVHTEEIAWQSYQLSKENFSWHLPKFKKLDLPDKMTVLFALEQAKKEKYGQLVSGRAGRDVSGELEGWRFTPEGAEWFRGNETRILEKLKEKAPDLPRLAAKRFIKKLKNEPCFVSFKENGNLNEVSPYMFTDMLACAPDASKDIIRQKFEWVLTTAKLVHDKEILDFLGSCSVKFAQLLTD